MSMQRITISLPKYLYEELTRQIPSGQVSRFVAQLVEKGLMELESDPLEEFINLRKKLPKRERKKILEAIKKGRK